MSGRWRVYRVPDRDKGIIDTIAGHLGEVYGWCQECGIGQSDNRVESAQGILAALRERYVIMPRPPAYPMNVDINDCRIVGGTNEGDD